MKQTISYNKEKAQNEFLEGGRIYYSKPLNLAWKKLKAGGSIELLGEFSDSGWCLVFVVIDGTEYQLTKKQIRTSDLKHYYGEV